MIIKRGEIIILLSSLLFVFISAQNNVVYAPTVVRPRNSDEVVAFLLQNPSPIDSISPRYITFGHPFYRTQLKIEGSNSTIMTGSLVGDGSTAGGSMDVQVDAKAHHPDGSVRQATLSLWCPSLAPNQTLTIMLTKKMRQHSNYQNISNIPSTVTVAIKVSGGASFNYVVSDLIKQTQKKNFWLNGEIATQARVQRNVTSSMRVIFDATLYKDNSWCVDVIYSNDKTMESEGGLVTYDTTITPSSGLAQTYTNVKNYQYSGWHRFICSTDFSGINVQYDQLNFIQSNAIFPINYTIGISQGVIDNYKNSMEINDWGKPLNPNGVTVYMPGTGDRADIGPVTSPVAAWFASQNKIIRDYVLGWGDASHHCTWNYYLHGQDRYYNNWDYPSGWIDYRGRWGQPTQLMDDNSGWTPETAHPPSLAPIPYMITGRRYYLDLVQSAASWEVMSVWPEPRAAWQSSDYIPQPDLGLFFPWAQTRAAAWGLRDVMWAAYLSEDGSWYQSWTNWIVNNNLDYYAVNFTTHMDARFSPEVSGFHGGGLDASGEISPWMEDHLITTFTMLHRHGYPQTQKILSWARNYAVASVFAKGWNPFNRAGYRNVVSKDDVMCKTWTCIQQNSNDFNVTSLASVGGNYAQLARQSFILYQYFDRSDVQAKAAEQWLYDNNAAYLDLGSNRNDIKYWIGLFPEPTYSDNSGTTGTQTTTASETTDSSAVKATALVAFIFFAALLSL